MVILSKYSICSWKSWLSKFPPSVALMETRLFFAIINSLTWFINASNFSISTRTVRLVTGLLAACFFPAFAAAGAAFFAGSCSFGAGAASAETDVSSFLLKSANFTSSAKTASISDTAKVPGIIFSRSSEEARKNVKSNSNFSSSISLELGR